MYLITPVNRNPLDITLSAKLIIVHKFSWMVKIRPEVARPIIEIMMQPFSRGMQQQNLVTMFNFFVLFVYFKMHNKKVCQLNNKCQLRTCEKFERFNMQFFHFILSSALITVVIITLPF